MSKKQINVTIPMDIYERIVEEAGIRQSKLKKVCPLSVIVNEIFEPAARAYFNGHNPIDNKQEVKPVEQQDSERDAEQEAQPSSNPFANVNIFGNIGE